MNDNLPPLPVPDKQGCEDDPMYGIQPVNYYTAEQMQAYARAAIEHQSAAPKPQPVQEQCPECDGTGTVSGSQAHFLCPLCTSPQAAQPLSDEQKQEIHNETGAGHDLISLVESYITKGTT